MGGGGCQKYVEGALMAEATLQIKKYLVKHSVFWEGEKNLEIQKAIHNYFFRKVKQNLISDFWEREREGANPLCIDHNTIQFMILDITHLHTIHIHHMIIAIFLHDQ